MTAHTPSSRPYYTETLMHIFRHLDLRETSTNTLIWTKGNSKETLAVVGILSGKPAILFFRLYYSVTAKYHYSIVLTLKFINLNLVSLLSYFMRQIHMISSESRTLYLTPPL